MKNNSQVAMGAIISYIQCIIGTLIGLVFVPILIRFLSDSEYGIYQLMYSFLSIILVLDCGLTGTITRYFAKYEALGDEEKKADVLGTSAVIYSVIIVVVIIICSTVYASMDSVYKELTATEINRSKEIMLIILVDTIVVVVSNLFVAVIQASERFVFLKLVILAKTVLLPIAAALLIIESGIAKGYFIAHVCLSAAVLIIYICFCRKKLNIRIKLRHMNTDLLREMGSFALFLFLNTVVDELYWRTGSLILGAVAGTYYVALNGTASTIVTQYRSFASVIHGLFLPRITKQLSIEPGNFDEINRTFIFVSKIQYYIVVLIFTGFVIFGKEFVQLWTNGEYSDSYILALIPMAGLIVPLTQSYAISVLRAINRQKFRAILLTAMAVANVCVSIPAAIRWNAIGVNVVTLVFLIIGNTIIMNFYYARCVQLDIKGYWRSFIRLSIAAAISLPIGVGLKKVFLFDLSWIALVIPILAYVAIFSLLFFVIGISSKDRSSFKTLLKGGK